MYIKSCSESFKASGHLEDLDVNGKILIWMLKKKGERVWTKFMWLRMETNGG
jgi:hypothetical protein